MSYRIQLGELDISEEAEELREFLYDIVSGYPSGIDSGLLEKLYVEKYLETGIGRSLPKDWLHQLQLAGEFEVKSIGGLTTVYIVHKGVSQQLEQIPPTAEVQKVVISDNIVPEKVEKPSEDEKAYENSNVAEILSVENDSKYCYARFQKRKLEFNNFLLEIAQFYTEHHKDADLYVENIAQNQAYVVLDTTGNWCRVIVKEVLDQSAILPCFLVDYGEIRSIVRRSLKKLDNAFSFENYSAFAVCCATSLLSADVTRSLPHLLNVTSQAQLKKLDATQIKFEVISTEENYNVVKFEDDSGKSQSIEYLKNSKPLVSKASSLPPPVPASNLNIICREPQEMPKKKEIVHIISATDPDNISIQFAAWHPAPAYLSAAMTRDSENSQPPPKEQIKEGNYYAAKLDDGWERVQIIRPSTTLSGGDYWVVYAIDVGNFHLVHWKQLRYLTESVSSFNKILLAKCKLNGIKNDANGTWSRELQQAMQDLLQSVDKSTVEFEPAGEWTKHSTFNSPLLPYAAGHLLIDGKNFADQLVSLGLAQKQ